MCNRKTHMLAILVMHAFVHCQLAKKRLVSDSLMFVCLLHTSVHMVHLCHVRAVDPHVILSGFVR